MAYRQILSNVQRADNCLDELRACSLLRCTGEWREARGFHDSALLGDWLLFHGMKMPYRQAAVKYDRVSAKEWRRGMELNHQTKAFADLSLTGWVPRRSRAIGDDCVLHNNVFATFPNHRVAVWRTSNGWGTSLPLPSGKPSAWLWTKINT
jgi:hypothetical protein